MQPSGPGYAAGEQSMRGLAEIAVRRPAAGEEVGQIAVRVGAVPVPDRQVAAVVEALGDVQGFSTADAAQRNDLSLRVERGAVVLAAGFPRERAARIAG